jgi:tetratricopeptide (TPR) repeat protein
VAGRAASRALGELVDYGLLVQLDKIYEVSHPLIHTYARQRLWESTDVAQHRALVARLVTVLAAHFPAVEVTNWADCERLVTHIQACATHLEQQHEMLVEAASVFSRAGAYLLERGRYEQAEELFLRTLAIYEQALPPDHPYITDMLRHYASLLNRMNRPHKAQRLHSAPARYRPGKPLDVMTTFNCFCLRSAITRFT